MSADVSLCIGLLQSDLRLPVRGQVPFLPLCRELIYQTINSYALRSGHNSLGHASPKLPQSSRYFIPPRPFLHPNGQCNRFLSPQKIQLSNMSFGSDHSNCTSTSSNLHYSNQEEGFEPVYTPVDAFLGEVDVASGVSEELDEQFNLRLICSNERTPGESESEGTTEPAKMSRPFCLRCRKAKSLCICVRIKAVVNNQVGITILQHPEEKDHHLGTARIAALSLRNVQVLSIPEVGGNHSYRVRGKVPGSKRSIEGRVGRKGRIKPTSINLEKLAEGSPEQDGTVDDHGAFDPYLIPSWMNLPPSAGLLFPSEKAEDLLPMESENLPLMKRPTHLIVLDGTWSKAKRIYFENLWLHNLPHYNLPVSAPSMYGHVRRQPKPGCLSTVESIVFALRLLEPETQGLNSLLEVFDSMILDAKKFQERTEQKHRESKVMGL